MMTWKDSLAGASRERTLKRARASVNRGTSYTLGKGGMNPIKQLTRTCDCSGFVAWAMSIPRELPPRSNKWLQTTTYWEGGGNVGRNLFIEARNGEAEPGDLYVYPDFHDGTRTRQGHMGIISEVKDGEPVNVIHCSTSNDKNGDAIQETGPDIFKRKTKTRIMTVDYNALRALFHIPDPELEPEDEEIVEIPFPDARLEHPFLADDPSLQMVARGELILEKTGDIISGCAALHDALNHLAVKNSRYGVNLGPNQKYRGYYGNQTHKAIKNFQEDNDLPVTGDTDAETIGRIDMLLREMDTPTPVPAPGLVRPFLCQISQHGRDYFASIDGEDAFFVGKKVSYLRNYGLTNFYKKEGPRYDPDTHAREFGHWAYMIYPSVLCESEGYFNLINTYDRAYFTFGFYQLAAHVPDNNFILLFRELLKTPEASRYFPDLSLKNGFICRETENGLAQLENHDSTQGLMAFLNPSLAEVEEREVIQAAKIIHWANTDPEHQKIQVKVSLDKLKNGMKSYSRRYPLDGVVDTVCLVVADIRHQGRGRSSEIINALDTGGDDEQAVTNLLEIGMHTYSSRIEKLKKSIDGLRSKGQLGQKRYHQQTNEFL